MAATAARSSGGDAVLDGAEVAGRAVINEVKPKLRGWLHAGMMPLALAAGVVLICLAPAGSARLGAAVFLAASLMLFGTSGLFHRFAWGERAAAVLRRLDHANIYLFIAATYTPIALILLHGTHRAALLYLIWAAAAAGVIFRLFWLRAPRALYTALYIAVGSAAIGWLGDLVHNGGVAVVALILAGGLCYTSGAIVYAAKRPNPSPRWFGFHEIFHAGTVGGFGCHFSAICLAVCAVR